jgi:hypothetical protein
MTKNVSHIYSRKFTENSTEGPERLSNVFSICLQTSRFPGQQMCQRIVHFTAVSLPLELTFVTLLYGQYHFLAEESERDETKKRKDKKFHRIFGHPVLRKGELRKFYSFS